MFKEYLVKIMANIVTLMAIGAFPVLFCLSLLHAIHRQFFGKRETINISNDVAVITGGAHGVGRAIAEKLAQKGCRIGIADINLELGEKTAKEIAEKYNVKTKAYKIDVSSYEQIVLLHKQVNYEFGKVTILVNNAGIMTFKNFANPEPNEIQRMADVNFTSHYYLNRTFLPDMKKLKRGYIVATCSLAGVYPLAFHSEYTGTKHGTRGHMRALRQQLLVEGFDNIICTTVMPYFLTTNEDTMQIVNQLGAQDTYPLITGEEVAERAVQGMLGREAEICLPRCMGILYRLLEIFPSEFQTLLMHQAVKRTGTIDKQMKMLDSLKTK